MKGIFALLFVFFMVAMVFTPAFIQASVTEDSWITKAPMQQARSGLGVIAVDGKIYAIGGSTSTGGITGANEMYDPDEDVWVDRASMPTPREYFAIAAYQNKIYCIGGQTGWEVVDEDCGFMHPVMSEVTEVYDTITDTWTTNASVPGPAIHITAQEINGKIYVTGVSHLLVYDIVSDSWTITVPPLSLPYSSSPSSSVAINGSIFITGEYSNRTGYEQKLYLYNLQNSSLTPAKTAPVLITSCVAAATTGVQAPQRVYVLGLTSENYPPYSVNQVYDPAADVWTMGTAMSMIRTEYGVAVVDDTLFAVGGMQITYTYDATGKYIRGRIVDIINLNEQYIPVGYAPISPSPTLSPSMSSASGNQQPATPEFSAFIVVVIVLVLVAAAMFLVRRRHVAEDVSCTRCIASMLN